jgi:hypothetical protein
VIRKAIWARVRIREGLWDGEINALGSNSDGTVEVYSFTRLLDRAGVLLELIVAGAIELFWSQKGSCCTKLSIGCQRKGAKLLAGIDVLELANVVKNAAQVQDWGVTTQEPKANKEDGQTC